MTLNDFCEKVDRAKNLEDLWSVCMEFFAGYGLSKASYHHFPPAGAGRGETVRVYAKGQPDAWIQEYVKGKLYKVDPIPGLAQAATKPFFWRDRIEMQKLAQPERDFIHWSAAHGVRDGLAIQVFGPNGRNGLVALGFGEDRPDLSLGAIRELQCACQIGHMIYIRVTSLPEPDAPALTAREREVLNWVSKGKSNSVIADIMGISNHTVDAYLRRIYLKLGVSDRISASIKGLGSGLISGNM